MKKVLLTSTALVMASASFAAAEIALSGSAEMGVVGATLDADLGDAGTISGDEPVQFFNDVDVTFSMSGETDGGLAFGVAVDLDEAANLGNELDNMGVAIFISSDFGTLTMGDTDGAIDFVITDMGNIGNPGSINDAETTHLAYLGGWLDGSGDDQVVRYDYSFDAFTFALSVEQMPSGPRGRVLEDDDGITWGIGGGYEFAFSGGSVDAGIGYQYSDDGSISFEFPTVATGIGITDDPNTPNFDESTGTLFLGSGEVSVWAVGATANLDNGFSAGFTYSSFDFDEASSNINHWGLGAGYAFDAFSVHANYGNWDSDDISVTGYGISAGYDLGGGASLLFGYGNSATSDIDFNADGENDDWDSSSYSLGLSFAF